MRRCSVPGARAERARAHLGWPMRGVVARRHAGGTSLALAAPCDQLFVATEVNEWALCAALVARDPHHWSGLEAALAASALEDAADASAVITPLLDEPAAFAQIGRASC